jgi:hypothetical protein
MMIYKKIVPDSLRKGRLLYLMGATWHTKCMFDVDGGEDSFATILNQRGIETYTFDNAPIKHVLNVDLGIKLINQYNIDYIFGYSYGCTTACDIFNQVTVKGLMLLDPRSTVTLDKQRVGDRFIVTKDSIRDAMTSNKVVATDSMRDSYINAFSKTESLSVPAYPIATSKGYKFDVSGFSSNNFRLFLTNQSSENFESQNTECTVRYPESTHWILIEPGRYKLAADVEDFIATKGGIYA